MPADDDSTAVNLESSLQSCTAHRERIAGLIESLAKSPAQPIYVAVDPATELEINRFNGGTIADWSPFVAFMKAMTAELDAR